MLVNRDMGCDVRPSGKYSEHSQSSNNTKLLEVEEEIAVSSED